ncbi:molybdenum cofactor biosysynthesis protein [Hoyosella sp. G463]|uniref:Molybdenum cofactor biosysynthesis protein n=1 Tax=Lolliginicoccus lacisalsi TaxID=2742202 RepID=A0A927PJQ3_9ACTN|nr:molybdenum cofactor biosysynthesis protein [Lolliginicoccus lacisalsi]MBD8505130.1 molybdenum cofactor biosysynthesis protein [Lolliginicoccus lacisalsi]
MADHPIRIVQFLVSPAHAYFGRPKDGPAEVPTELPARIECVAGKGIRGDRFFNVRAHTEAAVTFLAAEAWDDACLQAGATAAVELARRNIVVRGVELDRLRGEDFTLSTGAGSVVFRGGRPAHPCAWMDTMIAPGMRKALVGRGGIRAGVLAGGVLGLGDAILSCDVPLDASRAAEPVMRAQPLG